MTYLRKNTYLVQKSRNEDVIMLLFIKRTVGTQTILGGFCKRDSGRKC